MLKRKLDNIELPEFNKKTKKKENILILKKLPQEVVDIIGSFLDIKGHYKISYCNKKIMEFFKPSFEENVELAAYQAMIDGEEIKLINILTAYPEFLIKTPNKNLVIKSSLNGLRFYAEELLKMVFKTNQVNILNAIEKALPDMLKKVAEKNGNDAIKNFENKRIKLCKEYKNSEPEKKHQEFLKKYLEELKILIEAIAKSEDNGAQVIQNFRKKWLSDNKTIYLDKVDIKTCLLASYQAFDNYFNIFKNWDQRDAYCIKIIGFFQSLQFRETAEVFCQGLYDVVEENEPIGKIAKSLNLVNNCDISYYSAGVDFFVAGAAARGPRTQLRLFLSPFLLENYLIQKQSSLAELLTRFCHETTDQKMILNLK